MNFEDARQTFLAESHDMLEDMERLLLELDVDIADPERLDALFRCVHTIKGSAGLFELNAVVGFTHVVENVLDRLREGRIQYDMTLSALLLECRDHISELIALGEADVPEDIRLAGAQLLPKLVGYQDNASASAKPSLAAEAEREGSGDNWHISVRFSAGVLRNGMDPIGFIRYLGTLGEIVQLTTVMDDLPAPEDYDPENCYLGFEIDLCAQTSKADIEAVFEFVQDDCQLKIRPPGDQVREYLDAITDLSDTDVRLGEMLVASGAVTPAELNAGLSAQSGDGDARRIGEVLVETGAVHSETVQAALGKQQQVRNTGTQGSQYIRVQADKLDKLINLVGELVIVSASAEVAAQQARDAPTQEAIASVSTLVEEIRDSSLELRMVPIGETFQRFQRVVRDVSRELDKDIVLEISGAETELDKTVVEKIADPLTHLVRNAMDHGIESREQRASVGKSPQGKVCLNAYHEAGSIVIEVSDDGGGLRRKKILAKALERGVIHSVDGFSDQEIYQLIFEPGFSTADAVSSLSGRGVGMDVVRRNIEALRGNIEVTSGEDRGTTMRIRLPLTLAIIDGFLTGVADESYVVPLDSVVECVELSAAQSEEVRLRNLVNLRGEALPVIRLRDHFRVNAEAGQRENIVVVAYGNNKAGLIVDTLFGEYQTVIRPLGKLFSSLKGISGSTILGNGGVALILDVPTIVQRIAHLEASGRLN